MATTTFADGESAGAAVSETVEEVLEDGEAELRRDLLVTGPMRRVTPLG